MGFLDDLVKTALPVAAGAFLGPAAGTGLFGGLNPALSGALVSGGLGLLTGQKPKDALKSALLGGIGGYGAGKFGAAANPAASGQAGFMPFQKGITPPPSATQSAASTLAQTAAAGGGSTAGIPAKTMSAELLKGLGMAGDAGQENLLFKLLNTQVGEGILAGLSATAIDKLFGDDEPTEDNRGSFERRPYGAGGPGGKLGGINYADGGEAMYFPRRNGGIDPSEGSGTKDDVPAMLMAGEFVMTKDAVEGAGGGNLRKGINRMYNLMDQFEGMA